MTPDDPDDDDPMSAEPSSSPASSPTRPGLTVLLQDHDFQMSDDAADGSGMVTPVEVGLWEGEKMLGGIGSVKATVASMRLDGIASPRPALTPAGSRIARVPTPRPPEPPA
jgi:hypothetical protein